jgi:hypothetical protein
MPDSLMYNAVVGEDGKTHVSVFTGGKLLGPISDDHPNFKAIMEICHDAARPDVEFVDTDKVAELFDIPTTIVRKFSRLSDRVTIENGVLCFDHDPAQPGLSKQILVFLDKGDDVEPLVKFMEKIMRNPSDNSRDQAWAWLDEHDFSINEDGNVIGYKGVSGNGDGTYRSSTAGHAFVNDKEFVNSYIPNAVGDTIRMPRSEVVDNPYASCSYGLHIGTYEFAQGWAHGAMLRVVVDPADIVSVPNAASGQKIRVCKYVVDEIITSKDDPGLVKTETADIDVSIPVMACDKCSGTNPDLCGRFAESYPYPKFRSRGCEATPARPTSTEIAEGSKVVDPDSLTGTVLYTYRGHRGKKYQVKYPSGDMNAFYASELTLAK